MVVELGYGNTPLVGRQVRVAQRHLHGTVTQEIPYRVQRDAALNKTGGEMVSQMPDAAFPPERRARENAERLRLNPIYWLAC
jgi:hypothetical protein